MTAHPAWSGAVLTGGKSRRMGRDKALVEVDGEPMALRVAHALVEACEVAREFRFLYPDEWPIERKIETLATEMYGASAVDYEPAAKDAIA